MIHYAWPECTCGYILRRDPVFHEQACAYRKAWDAFEYEREMEWDQQKEERVYDS